MAWSNPLLARSAGAQAMNTASSSLGTLAGQQQNANPAFNLSNWSSNLTKDTQGNRIINPAFLQQMQQQGLSQGATDPFGNTVYAPVQLNSNTWVDPSTGKMTDTGSIARNPSVFRGSMGGINRNPLEAMQQNYAGVAGLSGNLNNKGAWSNYFNTNLGKQFTSKNIMPSLTGGLGNDTAKIYDMANPILSDIMSQRNWGSS